MTTYIFLSVLSIINSILFLVGYLIGTPERTLLLNGFGTVICMLAAIQYESKR